MNAWLRPRGVSVFVFHSVESNAPADRSWVTSEEQFQSQLDFIADEFDVLTVSEMLSLRDSTARGKPVACITFDDGDRSWVGLVRDGLAQRGLKASFYVATNQVQGRPIWHDRLSHCLASIRTPQLHMPWLGIRNMPSSTPEERALMSERLGRLFKYQQPATQEKMLMALEDHTGTSVPSEGLTLEDLQQLVSEGHEIGSHTKSHPILTHCDDAQSYTEIAESRDILSAALKVSIRSFSYPNGKPGSDYLQRHVDMVRRAGYDSAVSTALGSYRRGSNVWQIPRFTPWGRSVGSMRKQIFVNSWTRVVSVSQPDSNQAPPKVLIVENGSGFGGAVVALRSLLTEGLPMPVSIGVVSGADYGFGRLPGVAMTAVASSHSRRFAVLATRFARRLPWMPRGLRAFLLGRMDDLFVRLPYLLHLLVIGLQFRPDLVHGNNELVSNREALLLAKVLRVPYVQHVRGPSSNQTRLSHLTSLPDLYITVSRWLYFAALERGVPTARLRQLYDGVAPSPSGTAATRPAPTPLTAPLADRRGPVVAMVGMLVPWKGQGLFIEAVALIHRKYPQATFLIVGATPDLIGNAYEESLRGKVADLGLKDVVLFTGQIQELNMHMHAFDILVSASLEPEPLGLVMIEAIRSGCYFVGPDHGATAEFVDDDSVGALFVAGDSDSLANVLSTAIARQTDSARQTTVRAVRDIRVVDPPACAHVIASVYRSLLDTR